MTSSIPPLVGALLRHNEPATEAEDALLQNVLRAKRARLLSLDLQLCALHRERDELFDNVSQLQAAVSPLRRMPADVLGEIFDLCATFDPEPPVYNIWCKYDARFAIPRCFGGLDKSTAPWVLAQVSSHWRQVVMDYPLLWSRIFVNLERVDHVGKLASYLGRGGQHLIDVHVFAKDPNRVSPTLLNAVIATSPRWSLIDLDCPISLFRHLPTLSLPELTTFHVKLFPVPITDDATIITTFSQAHNLRRVSVAHLNSRNAHIRPLRLPSPLMSTVALPFSQIRELTTDRDGAIYLSPREGYPALRSFRFHPTHRNDNACLSRPGAQPLSCSLETLDIFLKDPVISPNSYMSYIFESFRFPTLTDLRLSPPIDYDRLSVMPTFTEHTAPELVTLHVHFVHGSLDDSTQISLCNILQFTPKLQTLVISGHTRSLHPTKQWTMVELFRRLSSCLVPELQTLDVAGASLPDPPFDDTLLSMLGYRWGKQSIKSVVLATEHKCAVGFDEYAPWAQLIDEGLDVRFRDRLPECKVLPSL
ncbi:hypothetical protein BDZ89DRAFT_1172867 [Hymenopellis radicata]|nr:hypothetical protein BDZ89DRAFT_1172867 [Hymenopellis radicata]